MHATYLDNVRKFRTEAGFAVDQESYSIKYQCITFWVKVSGQMLTAFLGRITYLEKRNNVANAEH
jgi:hypothetical protein